MFSLSNVIIQSDIIAVNNMVCPGGSFVLDGSSAAYSLESIASSVTSSICQTSMTFTSQCYGAKMYDRMKKSIINCIVIGFLLAGISSAFFILARNPLLKIYSIIDPLAKQAADTRIFYILSLYVIYGIMEAEQGLLRGLNKSIQATVTAIAGIGVFRVVWIELIAKPGGLTLEKILTAYPLSWFLVDFVYSFMIIKTLKQLKKDFYLKSSVSIQS